jgi:hypothetical protein
VCTSILLYAPRTVYLPNFASIVSEHFPFIPFTSGELYFSTSVESGDKLKIKFQIDPFTEKIWNEK